MPITNNHKTPDLVNKKRNINIIYIEHTSGVWLRIHIEHKEIELWIDGQFLASWAYEGDMKTVNGNVAADIAFTAIEYGKKQRSKEIKELLKG